jgi:hypothetical protein
MAGSASTVVGGVGEWRELSVERRAAGRRFKLHALFYREKRFCAAALTTSMVIKVLSLAALKSQRYSWRKSAGD